MNDLYENTLNYDVNVFMTIPKDFNIMVGYIFYETSSRLKFYNNKNKKTLHEVRVSCWVTYDFR